MASKDINPMTGKRIKTGGRKPGAVNKVSYTERQIRDAAHDLRVAEIDTERQYPKEFLSRVFNDPNMTMKDRIEAAKILMPYEHAKKPIQAEITGANGGAIELQADSSLDLLEGMLMEGVKHIIENEDDDTLADDIIEYAIIPQLDNNEQPPFEHGKTIQGVATYDSSHPVDAIETTESQFFTTETGTNDDE